jgi:hypothetical protein
MVEWGRGDGGGKEQPGLTETFVLNHKITTGILTDLEAHCSPTTPRKIAKILGYIVGHCG